MRIENSSFIVDGKYEDIVFEVEKELRQTGNFIDEFRFNDQQIKACAELVTEIMLCSHADDGSEDKFERGILLAKNRYYLKFDMSLFAALSCFVGQILLTIADIPAAESGLLSIGASSALLLGQGAGLSDVFRKIPEEAFCVLLAAHQHKSKHCVSLESIMGKLCSHDCPYRSVYRSAYGTFCNKHTPSGKCMLTKEDVVRQLRTLGKAYGITEIAEGKLFKAE